MTVGTGQSDVCTEGIRVRVGAVFLPEQSDREQGTYMYAYRVVLTNEGTRAAKLISRRWLIVDADNDRREVRGPGVVGLQPELPPGGRFEYSSHCPLQTEWGTMEGTYLMEREDGEEFEVEVGRFMLAPNVAPLTELDEVPAS